MRPTPGFREILDMAIAANASDIFLKAGGRLRGRVRLDVVPLDDYIFTEKDMERMVSELLDGHKIERLKQHRGYDLAIDHKDRWRFRVAIFYQRYVLSIVVRKIDLAQMSFEDLGLPVDIFRKFCTERQGLILLTGVTGSGKSTTIASMVSYINKNMKRHILTVEEPVEFVFPDDKSVVSQRELGADVSSYFDALVQFTLHSPDVIYIGTIRDQMTCQAALTAAETGVLVLSTMHTIDARTSVERIVNFFPYEQHDLVYNQLSALLKGVISMRLVPHSDGKTLIPAYEIMTLSSTISSVIREKKIWEIPKYIASGEIHDMISFNKCLFDLVGAKKISPGTALEYSNNREDLALQLRRAEII